MNPFITAHRAPFNGPNSRVRAVYAVGSGTVMNPSAATQTGALGIGSLAQNGGWRWS